MLAAMSLHSKTFTVGSFNVENLFDLAYSGNEYAEYIPNNSWQWNKSAYTKKLNNLSTLVCDLNADILALQEVENDTALKALQNTLKRKGCYYRYRAIAKAKNSVVNVAVLSKYPIVYSKEIWVNASRKYRNILEVKINIEGELLYLFVNHWKSKSGPESMRVQSAKALKKHLDTFAPYENIIIAGDFNSDYAEKEKFKKRRKHNDTEGITGINDILNTFYNGSAVTLDSLRSCNKCFYNLWYDLPKKERWSHKYRRYKEALDSILISQAFINGKGIDYVRGSFRRFTPTYQFKNGKSIYRWQISRSYPKHFTGKGYSDHLAIIATFHTTSR